MWFGLLSLLLNPINLHNCLVSVLTSRLGDDMSFKRCSGHYYKKSLQGRLNLHLQRWVVQLLPLLTAKNEDSRSQKPVCRRASQPGHQQAAGPRSPSQASSNLCFATKASTLLVLAASCTFIHMHGSYYFHLSTILRDEMAFSYAPIYALVNNRTFTQ